MEFTFAKIANWFFYPIFHWVLLSFLIWYLIRNVRRPVYLALSLAVYLSCILLLPIPQWSIALLERQAKAFADFSERSQSSKPKSEDISTAVVLTGESFSYDSTLGQFRDYEGSSRILESIRIFKKLNLKKLIISGFNLGTGSLDTEAQAMARLAQEFGIPSNQIIVESKSLTTYENAKNVVAILPSKEHFILVTSAYHLPRTLFCFRKFGAEPIPYPVDFQVYGSPYPVTSYWGWKNLQLWQAFIHELVGFIYYSYRGYI